MSGKIQPNPWLIKLALNFCTKPIWPEIPIVPEKISVSNAKKCKNYYRMTDLYEWNTICLLLFRVRTSKKLTKQLKINYYDTGKI